MLDLYFYSSLKSYDFFLTERISNNSFDKLYLFRGRFRMLNHFESTTAFMSNQEFQLFSKHL